MFWSGLRVLLSFVAVAAAQQAWCQPWPNKPVRIFVAQGAGGGQDTITRYLADRLATALGQQIIIENRPGAAGIIGTQAAARSVPDGYTFLIGSSAALASNPFTVKSLPYDPVKDFVPVALLTRPGFLIAVNSKRPIKTLSDLVAAGTSQPGKLSVVIDGSRNATGLVAAYLEESDRGGFHAGPLHQHDAGAAGYGRRNYRRVHPGRRDRKALHRQRRLASDHSERRRRENPCSPIRRRSPKPIRVHPGRLAHRCGARPEHRRRRLSA